MTGPSPAVMRFNERLLARHLLGAGEKNLYVSALNLAFMGGYNEPQINSFAKGSPGIDFAVGDRLWQPYAHRHADSANTYPGRR